MAKSFEEMCNSVTPSVRKAAKAKYRHYKSEIEAASTVKLIREASRMGQKELAAAMGISQPAIARFERQKDIKLSTLLALVGAAGGKIKINVDFPDRSIVIGKTSMGPHA